jgi:hypothetical protein
MLSRSEKIKQIKRVIASMKQRDPERMARVEAHHQEYGQTYLEYKIELMDLMDGIPIRS